MRKEICKGKNARRCARRYAMLSTSQLHRSTNAYATHYFLKNCTTATSACYGTHDATVACYSTLKNTLPSPIYNELILRKGMILHCYYDNMEFTKLNVGTPVIYEKLM
jgi:hypothetical protein